MSQEDYNKQYLEEHEDFRKGLHELILTEEEKEKLLLYCPLTPSEFKIINERNDKLIEDAWDLKVHQSGHITVNERGNWLRHHSSV